MTSLQASIARVFFAVFIGSLFLPALAADDVPHSTQETEAMVNIRITVNNRELSATLVDNAAAREFYALLPLTLTLTDYASTEKVSDLPKRLSKQGAPEGYAAVVGDITYYAPWGNLAIFYRDFEYARGLIKLGHITGDIAILKQPGPLEATLAPSD